MGCVAGILHSGLVRNNVVIDSCHIRLRAWGEELEISMLKE